MSDPGEIAYTFTPTNRNSISSSRTSLSSSSQRSNAVAILPSLDQSLYGDMDDIPEGVISDPEIFISSSINDDCDDGEGFKAPS
eukprot:TRINITY_DN6653_c1_g1_i1.p1 TRINITY_DN6653_c1_g1~~TRINITY_DN6653_c1_g1_i1.p1  ORF type:complete len:84 (+),score=10.97 TRINITY_DN6653_c1_g1_i1:44-295(+)